MGTGPGQVEGFLFFIYLVDQEPIRRNGYNVTLHASLPISDKFMGPMNQGIKCYFFLQLIKHFFQLTHFKRTRSG